MINYIKYPWTFLCLLSLAYCSPHLDICKNLDLRVLKIAPARANVWIPAYAIVDSLIIGNSSILNYNIFTSDSAMNIVVFVDKQSRGKSDINHLAEVQTAEIQNGRDSSKLIVKRI